MITRYIGGASNSLAVCCFGGYEPGTSSNNTEYSYGMELLGQRLIEELTLLIRNLGSFGVLETSGLAFAGGPPFGSAITESWDGTSWTETGTTYQYGTI